MRKNDPTWKITWRGSEDEMAFIADLMGDALDPPADAVSLRKAQKDGEPHPTYWLAEAYFPDPPDMDAISHLFTVTMDEVPDWAQPQLEELPDDDWVKFALGSLGPVQAGRFLLHGAHDRHEIPENDDIIPIEIEANQAFGTGHHPTTAGCLTLLDRFAGWSPQKILDLGCGSAVLAIAATKIWGKNILATDIDAKSVEIAEENVNLNHTANKVTVLESAGFDNPEIGESGPFDFIFANILAGPLVELAPDMAKHCTKNGRIMLAGLMTEQEEKVENAYTMNGFKQINRLDHPTWPVLLYVKT